jgi:AraC family transcriptional regulator
MQFAARTPFYTDVDNGQSRPRLRTGKEQPANDVVSLLEAIDVRIAAGLTTLRRGDSARDHLDQARELISGTLRRADVSALAALRTPPARSESEALHYGGLAPRKARQLTEYIELRLAERLAISEMAGVPGLSRSHFCRAFRATFNQSPRQYIEARRIERAQRLMIETDQSLLQIALACGFNDPAHFSKTFRNAVGLSPSRWRRMHRD